MNRLFQFQIAFYQFQICPMLRFIISERALYSHSFILSYFLAILRFQDPPVEIYKILTKLLIPHLPRDQSYSAISTQVICSRLLFIFFILVLSVFYSIFSQFLIFKI